MTTRSPRVFVTFPGVERCKQHDFRSAYLGGPGYVRQHIRCVFCGDPVPLPGKRTEGSGLQCSVCGGEPCPDCQVDRLGAELSVWRQYRLIHL